MKQAKALTELLLEKITEKTEDKNKQDVNFFLAISGGSSPKQLFSLWRGDYREKIPWDKIELFWVDERCVPPSDKESNYGIAKKELLDRVPLPFNHIHRIKGEDDPLAESTRYSKLVTELLPEDNGIPIFDFIILGIGEDGHTSSIFPGQTNLLNYKFPYAPSVNPYSGQKRVAMTGLPIIEANNTAFYLVGASKRVIIDSISKKVYTNEYASDFPAAYLFEKGKNVRIFWDL